MLRETWIFLRLSTGAELKHSLKNRGNIKVHRKMSKTLFQNDNQMNINLLQEKWSRAKPKTTFPYKPLAHTS